LVELERALPLRSLRICYFVDDLGGLFFALAFCPQLLVRVSPCRALRCGICCTVKLSSNRCMRIVDTSLLCRYDGRLWHLLACHNVYNAGIDIGHVLGLICVCSSSGLFCRWSCGAPLGMKKEPQ